MVVNLPINIRTFREWSDLCAIVSYVNRHLSFFKDAEWEWELGSEGTPTPLKGRRGGVGSEGKEQKSVLLGEKEG